jgi:tetratricopeptide (TPR) repeat protein
MQEGYSLLEARQQTAAACDKWLEAWEMVKQMAEPDVRTTTDFDSVYPGMMQSVFNWCGDLEMELGNAGLDDPAYHEHRVRYVREYLAQFPEEDENRHINLRRAEGEALWRLGKQAEAEAVFQALVDKFPDNGWGYIGWSDEYYLWSASPGDYEAGEAILLRALDRPNLEDRRYVLERLDGLYEKWGQPEKRVPLLAELDRIKDEQEAQYQTIPAELEQLLAQFPIKPLQPDPPEQPDPPKRNAPCWCGSGKKYKFCHMRSDRQKKKR